MRASLFCLIGATICVGLLVPASARACGITAEDAKRQSCPNLSAPFEGRGYPINSAWTPFVSIRQGADTASLKLLRTSDESAVPFTLVPPASLTSDPAPYQINLATREVGEYALEGTDTCRSTPRIATFRITAEAPYPTRLGDVTASVTPTEDVKEQAGVDGGCRPVYRSGRVTKVKLTLAADPSVTAWRDLTAFAVEIDGKIEQGYAALTAGPVPAGDTRELAVFCGGEAQFEKSRTWLAPGTHSVRLLGQVDSSRAGGPITLATDAKTFEATCADADDSSCSSRPGPTKADGGLLVLLAVVAAVARRRSTQ